MLVNNAFQDRLFYSDIQPQDTLREVRHLMKASLAGMKSMLTTMFTMHKSFVTSVAGAGSTIGNHVLSDDEIDILKYFVGWTLESVYLISERHSPTKELFHPSYKSKTLDLHCQRIRRSSTLTDSDVASENPTERIDPSPQSPLSQDFEQDIKTFLEQLMNIFVVLSQASLIRTILSYNLEYLLLLTQTKPIFVSLVHYLLMINSTKCSQMTMDCVINFIVTRLPMLSNEEESQSSKLSSNYASAILRLFKVAVGVIAANPDNERVLRTKLKGLLLTSFRLARESRMTINYIHIFRTLFRSLTGKFDQSFKEIGSILPEIISGFDLLLQRNSHNLTTRCAIYELYFTIPCRLEALFPHFIRLLEIFLEAIHERSIESLVALALRTMEQWIDNVNHQYFFSLIQSRSGLASKIFNGICLHLKPLPYPYGALAIRILGKLGGKNRLFFRDQLSLPTSTSEIFHDSHQFYSPSEEFVLQLGQGLNQPTESINLPLDPLIHGACCLLESLLPYSQCITSELLSLQIPSCHSCFDETSSPKGEDLSNNCILPKSLKEDLQKILNGQKIIIGDSSTPLTAEEISQQLLEESNYSVKSLYSDQLLAAYHLITFSISQCLSRYSETHYSETLSPTQLTVDIGIQNESSQGLPWMNTSDDAQKASLWKELFHGFLCASCYPSLRVEAQAYLVGLCYHIAFATISVTGESDYQLVLPCFYEAILFACRSHRWDLYSVGISTLRQWIHTFQELSAKNPSLFSLDLLSPLLSAVHCSCCEGTSWNERMSGVRVIYHLSKLIPSENLRVYAPTIFHSLFAVIGYAQPNRYSMVLEDVLGAMDSIFSTIYNKDLDSGTVDQDIVKFLFHSLLDSRVLVRIASQFALHLLAKELYQGSILDLFLRNEMKEDLSMCLTTSSSSTSPSQATNDQLSNIGFISRLKYLVTHLISTNCLPLEEIFNYMKLLFQYYDDTLFNGNVGMNTLLKTEEIKRTTHSSLINSTLLNICKHENSDVIFLLLPTSISEKIEIILQIISLIEAVVKSEACEDIMNDKYITFRIECFQFLYNCLLYLNWEDVILASGQVMYEMVQLHFLYYSSHSNANTSHISGSVPSSTAGVGTSVGAGTGVGTSGDSNQLNFDPIGIFNLSEKIKIFLTLFDHPRHMTLDKLKKLEVLLRLCKNKNYIKVGYKLLEHLKFWIEPEKVIQLNIWPPGEEIYVAAAMMNIFSILPWGNTTHLNDQQLPSSTSTSATSVSNNMNEEQSNQMHLIPFIRRFVEILVKLNRVLCHYRSFSSLLSPYMTPLSRFMTTYTHEWITFFSDPLTLMKNEVRHLT
jgi:hypothetical protein